MPIDVLSVSCVHLTRDLLAIVKFLLHTVIEECFWGLYKTINVANLLPSVHVPQ